MTAVSLEPNVLSGTRVQGSQEPWTQWLHWSLAGQIDWLKSVFLQTKATHFEMMMTTVNEVNTDTIKILDEYILRSVLLVCFTAELDEKTDSQSMYMYEAYY